MFKTNKFFWLVNPPGDARPLTPADAADAADAMNAVLTLALGLLALAACTQAAVPRDDALTVASTSALIPRLGCYFKAVWTVVEFVADIPRNCVDLARRSNNPLYVLPSCVVYSGAASYQLTKNLFAACNASQ